MFRPFWPGMKLSISVAMVMLGTGAIVLIDRNFVINTQYLCKSVTVLSMCMCLCDYVCLCVCVSAM